ncbi:toxin-antitoxin system YwqK family antitoxin [Cystobacter ferrugineus]|uniref:Toxin-antitoxin system YwqK family antitoxin n=1 Tax=Cystobacter ferrugineus TaxID=83449 RepID=A0A1L9BIC4_9BACT|nr:hypothetical protein [Cystobacter ferrugineus]OJH42031.1 hypothetical protein BON30_02065 [Cystobacter ferrugineus]
MPTEFIEKDERGRVRERYFEDDEGRLEGVAATYDEGGRLVQESHWRAGLLHGPTSLYGSDGQLVQRVLFADGQLHGPAEIQDEQGRFRMQLGFHEGRTHGELLAWRDGQPLMKHTLEEDRPEGPLELYEEGKLTRRVFFERGWPLEQGQPAEQDSMAPGPEASADRPEARERQAREQPPGWLQSWLRGGGGS